MRTDTPIVSPVIDRRAWQSPTLHRLAAPGAESTLEGARSDGPISRGS